MFLTADRSCTIKYFFLNSYRKTYLPYSLRMQWANFWRPTVHLKRNIFEQNINNICSPSTNASLGIFCVQICQLLKSHWVFEDSRKHWFCFKNVKTSHCDSNIWPIGMQMVTNEALFYGLQIFFIFCSKDFCMKWTAGCSRIVHYIHMEVDFFLLLSVIHDFPNSRVFSARIN